MSAVKIFALGVMVTGTLASSTRAGSMRGGHHSPIPPAGRTTAAPTSLSFSASPVATPAPALTFPAQQSSRSTTFPNIATENLAGSRSGQGSGIDGNGPRGVSNGGWSARGGPLVLGTSGSTTSGPPIPLNGGSLGMGSSAPAPPANPPARADAFINFGNGPFREADSLTTGNAQPFTSSPAFTHFFQNGPTSQDIRDFENQVVATVQKTYDDAGLPIHLTDRPDVAAAHTLSVVSGTWNHDSPSAIGITDVGNNGFSFIDKLSDAKDPQELATAVGHNVAHELMHAFGLANHPESIGPYVDAATTTFSNLGDPNTDFSPVAASLLSTLNFQATGQSITAGAQHIDGNQILVPQQASPVPEPSTVALWALASVAVVARRGRRKSA